MENIIGKTLQTKYDPAERRSLHGTNGRILHVDLSDGRLWVEEPGEEFYRKNIGGRGFGLHYLLKELPPKTDPLSPGNIIVFAAGVLTGMLPGGGRHGVACKSPLTGALASGEPGGWWGVELKRSGFDAIVIRGRAPSPVYLWIKDGKVEIRDAAALWGKPTADVEEAIRAELGDDKIRVAQIGPAGERLVRYACVINDRNRAAGRSGHGAVMGSKNLKAIAVRGSSLPGFFDRKQMDSTIKWITGGYKEMMCWAVNAGTAGSVNFLHDIGSTPMNNFRDPVFEGVRNLDASHTFPLLLKERDTCHGCPVQCKNTMQADESMGWRVDPRYGGPEYESIGALGAMCLVGDPVAVAKANELCGANGLDTISTGCTIAFTMECVEKGLITPQMGFDFLPRIGDGASLVKSVELIAARQGIGDWMAEGSLRLAQRVNAPEEMVITTRGQEFPMHDGRLQNALALGYALSPTGADHMHNMADTFANNPDSEICGRLKELGFETPMPLFGLPDQKIRAFVTELAFKYFEDSAVICQFYVYEYRHMMEALKAVAGWDMTKEDIVEVGLRLVNMGRLFLQREGFSAADDRLPPREFQPHTSGPIAGKALTPQEFQAALDKYYSLMDWEDGMPSRRVIERYNLQEYLVD